LGSSTTISSRSKFCDFASPSPTTADGCSVSSFILEYADVLQRNENLQQFWVAPDEVEVILGLLASRLQPVPIYFQWRPQLSDSGDEMVLECAINAQAAAIITFNLRDFYLLRLGLILMWCSLVSWCERSI
jgi:hypothetical protein